MAHGIVVDHKESGVRFAVSESNFNEKTMTKVRDLKPGESVRGFTPKSKKDLTASEKKEAKQADKTEGSAPAAATDTK